MLEPHPADLSPVTQDEYHRAIHMAEDMVRWHSEGWGSLINLNLSLEVQEVICGRGGCRPTPETIVPKWTSRED